MPKKKSIKGSANEFKAETDKILAFLTAPAGLGDEHVSWCHDLAIIRLYRAFESLMLDALVGALNNDASTLSTRTGFSFPKHLTNEVCRFLVTGRGYFDFKGRDGLIKALIQARWTTDGSDARASHGHERPPECAPAKKLAQVLRELRAEESRTGRIQDAGPPRRGTCRSVPRPGWCRGTRK
jgi:hypothetical protein